MGAYRQMHRFEPWEGSFYPDDLPKKRQLEYAASKLKTIEVNGTFYRSQKPETFAKWASEAPEGFVFSLKAPRYAVNRKVLAEGGESIQRFVESGIAELGDKLGPLLWQLAATKQFDPDDFGAFLKLLPASAGGIALRNVVELRHESFACPQAVQMCREAGVRRFVDALGDVGRLRMQQDVDLGVLPVKAVLLVADIADRTTRGRPETTGIDDFVAVLVGLHQAGRQANLAGDDDAIRGRQGLAGDANRPRVNASLLGLSIDQIDDLIGDPVADLVGMALRHAFAGEDIVRTRHRFLFPFLENPAWGSQTRELVVPLSTTTGTYARLVHGFLHLMGLDHMIDTEADDMEAAEIAILAEFGIADPYGDEPGPLNEAEQDVPANQERDDDLRHRRGG